MFLNRYTSWILQGLCVSSNIFNIICPSIYIRHVMSLSYFLTSLHSVSSFARPVLVGRWEDGSISCMLKRGWQGCPTTNVCLEKGTVIRGFVYNSIVFISTTLLLYLVIDQRYNSNMPQNAPFDI